MLCPALGLPFSDETGRDGAAAFASPRCVVAHSIAAIAFVLLALGPCELSLRLQDTRGIRRARGAVGLGWTGVGTTLPSYGAEVFGLLAVGRAALDRHDPHRLDTLASAIRWEAGLWFMICGLLLLAVAGVLAALAVWAALAGGSRWAGCRWLLPGSSTSRSSPGPGTGGSLTAY